MRKNITLRFIFIYLVLISFFSFSQRRKDIDSLLNVLKTQKEDSSRIKSLLALSFNYNVISKLDSANFAVDEALRIAQKSGLGKFIVGAKLQKASNLQENGKFEIAEIEIKEALEIARKEKNLLAEADCQSSLGAFYYHSRDFPKAETCYQSAISIYEQGNNTKKAARLNNALGLLEMNLGNNKESVKYFMQGLHQMKKDGNVRGIAMISLNMALLFSGMGDNKKSAELLKDSYENYVKCGDIRGKALAIRGMGEIFRVEKKYAEALEHFDSSLAISKRTGYYPGVQDIDAVIADLCSSLLSDYQKGILKTNDNSVLEIMRGRRGDFSVYMGARVEGALREYDSVSKFAPNPGFEYIITHVRARNELRKSNYKGAIEMFNSAIKAAEANSDYMVQAVSYQGISEAYAGVKDFQKAHEFIKKYSVIRDSMMSDEKNKAIMRSQAEYEFKEKENAIRIEQEREKIVREAEKKQQDQQKTFMFGFVSLLSLGLLSAVFAYRRKAKDNKIMHDQKIQIEQQKHIVEEKNKEVTESIQYAKRLQQAIMPSAETVLKYLPESFILYLPKDIVAGDFYWMEIVAPLSIKADCALIAAADCTGHGVPGALVSIVCSNALKSAVNEFGLTQPSKILDKSREMVVETFKSSPTQVRDGMDISLASVHTNSQGKALISWAGANNPLWYFRKNEFHEIKADKQPVGASESYTPFTNHEIELEKGDMLYLFSDGFSDQFGGPDGKKFKTRQLIEFLKTIQHLTPNEQKEKLLEEFNKWKGKNEQIDDVMMIGIRI